MKTEGRPTSPVAANSNAVKTVSGNKALEQATKLIFETGTLQSTGIDFPKAKGRASRLGANNERQGEIGLPGLSEPETITQLTSVSIRSALAR